MLAANPGAKLVMIQLAGHLPNPEKSEGCIEAVRDFLKQFCLGWRWAPTAADIRSNGTACQLYLE